MGDEQHAAAGLRADPPIGLGETFDGAARPGLRNAEGAVWLQASKVSLRQGMPLQATLFQIVEELAKSLLAGGIGAERLAGAATLD